MSLSFILYQLYIYIYQFYISALLEYQNVFIKRQDINVSLQVITGTPALALQLHFSNKILDWIETNAHKQCT